MRRRKAPQPPTAAAGDPATRRRKLDPPPVDCISTLPDDLLREIIILLPIKDGGRTQALASRWRHLWRSIPLDLDCRDLLPVKNSLPTSQGPVSRALSAHPGPGRRFCVASQCPAATLDEWLRSTALDSLEELELTGLLTPLPASTFRFSATLRVTNIGNCHLPDAAVQGLFFPQLKQLRLEGVNVSERSLQGLISGCPSLEFLSVHRGFGFRRLLINSLALRSISVRIDEPIQSTTDFQFGELVIDNAPSLERSFQLYRHSWRTPVSVISAPNKLETLGFLTGWHKVCARLDCSSIRGLYVDSTTAAVHTVKTMAIDMRILSLDTIVDLMTLFPCLEKLHVKSVVSWEKNYWRRKHRSFLKCHDIRLKTLVLEPYLGTLSHVNFATFFVLNARALELMQFQVPAKVYNDEFLAQQHRKLELDQCKASSGSQFHFTTASYQHVDSSSKHFHDFDFSDPFLARWILT